jgi:hypothetical protein
VAAAGAGQARQDRGRPPAARVAHEQGIFSIEHHALISHSLTKCRLPDYAASGNRREGLRGISGDHCGSGRHNQRLSKKASTGS